MLEESNAFLKIDVPYRKQYLTPDFSKGKARRNLGDFHYYNLRKPYRIFDPKMFSIIRPDFFSYAEIFGNDTIAHKDYGVSVNLNIYVETADGVTEFFNPKDDGIYHTIRLITFSMITK